MKSKIGKSKGFTLIELIVVMAVILVISSLLIPRFNGYRNKAQSLKVIDTGRQIYLAAVESYTEGNGEFSKDGILKATKDLLGIDELEVDSKANNISIVYKVDNKQYSVNFNELDNGFIIKDSSDKQIYPPANSKQASTIE